MRRLLNSGREGGWLSGYPFLVRLFAPPYWNHRNHRMHRALLQLSLTLLTMSASGVLFAADADAVLEVMARADRLADERDRDARSKPQFVIPLLNLEPGDRVIDLFAGGGYYSELLAGIVGSDGEVILHNNPGFESWGVNQLNDRFSAERSLDNVTRHTRSGINLDLQAESVDAALIVMALHDLYVIPKRYNGQEYVRAGNSANTDYFYGQLHTALKPGGRFVVIDHQSNPDSSLEAATDLHRIDQAFIRSELSAQGFTFIGSSEVLSNPDDDHDRIVFDEDLQGHTDRFILVFEKAASASALQD